MAQRTTDKDLKWAQNRVNNLLKGTGHKVFVDSRYGYKAVDLGYEKPEEHHHGIRRTLVTGISSGTALMYLDAMGNALELKERKLKDVI
jgi:hypothetical protein